MRLARGDQQFYANEDRAKQYDSSVQIWEDGRKRVAELALNSEMTILEIGPGPGVMTIPLAERVSHITVVEPSGPMIALLKNHLSDAGYDTVTIIQKPWESVTLEETGDHDLVLASYCLDMTDIRENLQKMCDVAQRYVHLWWFLGVTSWEKVHTDLLPERGYQTPKVDLLMDIITDMGYAPEMEILSGTSFSYKFETLEEAGKRLKSILNVPLSEDLSEDAIRYIEENWRTDDGGYMYKDSTTYVHITIPTGSGE